MNNLFGKTGDFINKVPNFMSYNTELVVKGSLIGIVVVFIIILAIVLKKKSNKEIKGLEEEVDKGKLSNKDKLTKNLEINNVRKSSALPVIFVGIVLSIGLYLGFTKYNDYLLYNRFNYSEEVLDKISKEYKKVTKEVKDIKVQNKSVNAMDNIFSNSNKEVKNGYYGQYGNKYDTLYKATVTLNNGEEITSDVLLLPAVDKKEENKLEYYESKDGKIYNTSLRMNSDELSKIVDKADK